MNLKNKQEIIEKFGANAKDTGSAEVQIAMLTQKISELTEHMKANKKDFATKRGLLMMVGKRKRLLSYLKEKNLDGYRSLIKELNINNLTPVQAFGILADLKDALCYYKKDETITVVVQRRDKYGEYGEVSVQVTLQDKPAQ